MRSLAHIDRLVDGQRGALFLWSPVFLASGIGTYFALRVEPGAAGYAGLAILWAVTLLTALGWRRSTSALLVAVVIWATGVMLAGSRAHRVAAPQIEFRYYGPIEGRVVRIDRSVSDKPRLMLDQVVLRDTAPRRTPGRVRVSVHGDHTYAEPPPGARVMMTGHLSPPQGPVEPGGFDFRRHAWFLGLGAVGYTRNPVMLVARAEAGSPGLWITQMRMSISRQVRAALPGEPGGFAAAILTGDRSGIGRETIEDLRASNLAHLLAISGLHMGLLTGFVFAALRVCLALVPWVALRLPTKKIAAAGALGAGAFYLALSGGSVATERAFIMVAVVLGAVLLNRRALTLRAVALAALIVLTLRPETLVSPGFQMSFAATTALIAAFGAMREFETQQLPRWARPVLALVISSAVAGFATAPFSAAHFNQIAQYGLIANLTTVPLMGTVVIPAAVLAAVLSPFGGAWIGLWAMETGVRWILWVAGAVADIEGALVFVPAPGAAVLPLVSLGGSLWVIWRGHGRWLGVPVMLAGFALWTTAQRPDALIAASGGLVGVMTDEGRALSKSRGDGFSADIWLENDGAPVDQQTAHAREGFQGEGLVRWADFGGERIVHLTTKRATENAGEWCNAGTVLVTANPLPDWQAGQAPCEVLDPTALRQTGAIALYLDAGGTFRKTALDEAGQRLWNGAVRAGR